MTVQMTLGVQSFCVGDGHFSAVKHNLTVGKWLEAIWQGCLVLVSGGNVVIHHADCGGGRRLACRGSMEHRVGWGDWV